MAGQSGLFDLTDKPVPYTVSGLLLYKGAAIIIGKGWSATKFPAPVDVKSGSAVAVVNQQEPWRVWFFSSSQDTEPRSSSERWYPRFLVGSEQAHVRLSLQEFDDLQVLK